jgi:hypothetical protein
LLEKPRAGRVVNPGAYRAAARLHYPDVWAMDLGLSVDAHTFDVKGREYVRGPMRDDHPYIIVIKGAQLGLTITFLVKTVHKVVVRKRHSLYLVPYKAGAIPFVQRRIDPIIQSSQFLRDKFKNVDNRLHKQTVDDVALMVRGTNIETELREIPTSDLILDERDKMVEENLTEAFARLGGTRDVSVVELSTPTAPGHGVDSEDAWRATDMHRWWVPCPNCGRYQVFVFEENVQPWLGDKIEQSLLCCKHCKKPITDDERANANALGRWEPDVLNASKRGYHVSQLNSPTMPLVGAYGAPGILDNYYGGQRDAKLLKAFFNNQLGLPYVAYGDQITPEMLDKCRESGFSMGGIPVGPVFLGVDVGHKVLHLLAHYKDYEGKRRLWDARIMHEFSELRTYLDMLSSFVLVIDADPARREVEKLAEDYPNRVWMAWAKDLTQQNETAKFSPMKYDEPGKVVIDRTMAFDTLINSYMLGQTILPSDAREIGELQPRLAYNGFYYQMCQQVREEEYDAKERLVARWKKNKNPDHWHHADMFGIVATLQEPPLVVGAAESQLFVKSGNFFR